MAKVKIQGHASGTGILTVTAPNTSTDRTITLPDATATIATTTDVAARLPSITDNGNATAITIDSSENIGIGVVPESWKSNSEAFDIGARTSLSDNEDYITDLCNNAYYDGSYKYKDTEKAVKLHMYDGKAEFKVAASGSADAAITWTTGFEVLNDGKTRAKNGLLFGTDTAAANTLDDYEEGTWTPALTATTTAPSGMNYGFRSGDYTKIGDMVICRFGIKMNSIGNSGAGSVTIAGLPFTSISYGAYQEPNFSVNTGNNSTAMTHVRFFVQGGATTCQGRRADTNADTTLVWSDLSNTSYFITCEIKYKTAS